MPVMLALLAASTVEALDRAGLAALGDKVAKQITPRLHDLDPMWAEILLLELRTTARMPHLTREERAKRVEWALAITGWS